MGDLVNLNKARKARTRAADKTRAAENRTRFGRPKAETAAEAAERALAARRLEGHRREEE